jgi:hypothetical protein
VAQGPSEEQLTGFSSAGQLATAKSNRLMPIRPSDEDVISESGTADLFGDFSGDEGVKENEAAKAEEKSEGDMSAEEEEEPVQRDQAAVTAHQGREGEA